MADVNDALVSTVPPVHDTTQVLQKRGPVCCWDGVLSTTLMWLIDCAVVHHAVWPRPNAERLAVAAMERQKQLAIGVTFTPDIKGLAAIEISWTKIVLAAYGQ